MLCCYHPGLDWRVDMPPPNQTHLGQSRRLGNRAGYMGAGASEGQAWWLRGLRSAPTAEPHDRAPRQSQATRVPTRANHGVQPGSSPATRSRGHRNGLCHPPLGSKNSLVPTVEKRQLTPGQAAPTPLAHVPAPLHLHLCLTSWSAPPPHPTPSPGPPPSGATRETPSQLLPGAAAGPAQY